MGEYFDKNAVIPSDEDLEFVFGLGYQWTHENLVNYIASFFNAIHEKSLKKLKVYSWTYTIRWCLHRVHRYDDEILALFYEKYFRLNLLREDYEFLNWNKSLQLLENIEIDQPIATIGENKFETVSLPAVSDYLNKLKNYERLSVTNSEEFSKIPVERQENILRFYKIFEEEADHIISGEDFFQISLIAPIVKKYLREEVRTDDNIRMISRICEQFTTLNGRSNTKTTTISDDELRQLFEDEISIDGANMIQTAYYLHYVVLSLGNYELGKNNPFEIDKFIGKQADILQRLLCSVTSENWDRLNQKSNSYYKAVNSLFKISCIDEYEIQNLIDQLEKVEVLLKQGGFNDAIMHLDLDISKIKNTDLEEIKAAQKLN